MNQADQSVLNEPTFEPVSDLEDDKKLSAMSTPDTPTKFLIAEKVMLISYFAFIALFAANFQQFYNPTAASHWLFYILEIAPALAFLPWLLFARRRRPVIGLCFVLLIYFSLSVINIARPVAFPLTIWLELLAQFCLFCSGMMFCRWMPSTPPQ